MNQASYSPCPFCGEKRVSVTVLTARGGQLHVVQSQRALTLFSGKSSTSPLTALTCTGCGFTAFYATQPANLLPDG